MPAFLRAQRSPPSVDLNTPRPKPVTYSEPPGSRRMWVAAVCGMPAFCTRQVRPPSSLRTTPPSYASGDRPRHILGRGRSCTPLMTGHIRPRTLRSNSIQYVVLTHDSGMPLRVALYQLAPPLSLAKSPISV